MNAIFSNVILDSFDRAKLVDMEEFNKQIVEKIMNNEVNGIKFENVKIKILEDNSLLVTDIKPEDKIDASEDELLEHGKQLTKNIIDEYGSKSNDIDKQNKLLGRL